MGTSRPWWNAEVTHVPKGLKGEDEDYVVTTSLIGHHFRRHSLLLSELFVSPCVTQLLR